MKETSSGRLSCCGISATGAKCCSLSSHSTQKASSCSGTAPSDVGSQLPRQDGCNDSPPQKCPEAQDGLGRSIGSFLPRRAVIECCINGACTMDSLLPANPSCEDPANAAATVAASGERCPLEWLNEQGVSPACPTAAAEVVIGCCHGCVFSGSADRPSRDSAYSRTLGKTLRSASGYSIFSFGMYCCFFSLRRFKFRLYYRIFFLFSDMHDAIMHHKTSDTSNWLVFKYNPRQCVFHFIRYHKIRPCLLLLRQPYLTIDKIIIT
eukprot:284815949_4